MRYFLTICLLLPFAFALAQQKETRLVVRAKAKDAKFIGSSIGGAYVVVKEAHSGKILAEGLTQGSTGNTQRIMQEPHQRHQPLSDEQAARFEAKLMLEKPLFATVEVWAPYNQPGARVHAQTQVWLIPGKHILGDGLVLEIPGFIVNVLAPQTHEALPKGKAIPLKASVVLTCGCPVTPGGIWNATSYQAETLVYADGKLLQQVPMQVQSKESLFEASFTPAVAGNYELIVTVYDPQSGNTGVGKVNIIVK